MKQFLFFKRATFTIKGIRIVQNYDQLEVKVNGNNKFFKRATFTITEVRIVQIMINWELKETETIKFSKGQHLQLKELESPKL